MTNRYLHLLSKELLSFLPDGCTKVRFAKLLYFSHKELIRNRLASSTDMKYIRMPLGPVPVGFKSLDKDPEIRVSQLSSPALVYDMQIYKLVAINNYMSKEQSKIVKNFVDQTRKLATSVLVEEAHKDPSWLSHKNGEEYYIGDDDLVRKLPVTSGTQTDPTSEAKKIQAKLVEGMIEEIVDESTSLEYPHLSKNED